MLCVSKRTEYPNPVLKEVKAEAIEAERRLREALTRLEEETLEDTNRADWENMPALETDDGHETEADSHLRVALMDARDSLAVVDDLVSGMLNGAGDRGREEKD